MVSKTWAEDTNGRLGILYESPPETKYTPSPFKCPIDRVEILTRLYAPSLKNTAKELRDRVSKLQTALERYLQRYEDYPDEVLEDIYPMGLLTYNQEFADVTDKTYEEFKITYEKFLSSLEVLVLKS